MSVRFATASCSRSSHPSSNAHDLNLVDSTGDKRLVGRDQVGSPRNMPTARPLCIRWSTSTRVATRTSAVAISKACMARSLSSTTPSSPPCSKTSHRKSPEPTLEPPLPTHTPRPHRRRANRSDLPPPPQPRTPRTSCCDHRQSPWDTSHDRATRRRRASRPRRSTPARAATRDQPRPVEPCIELWFVLHAEDQRAYRPTRGATSKR